MELVNTKYDKFIEYLKRQSAMNPHSNLIIKNGFIHYNPYLPVDIEWIFAFKDGKLYPRPYLQVRGTCYPWFTLCVSRDRWWVRVDENIYDLGFYKYQKLNIVKPIVVRNKVVDISFNLCYNHNNK